MNKFNKLYENIIQNEGTIIINPNKFIKEYKKICDFIDNSAWHWDDLKKSIMIAKNYHEILIRIIPLSSDEIYDNYGLDKLKLVEQTKALENMIEKYTDAFDLKTKINKVKKISDIPKLVNKSKMYEVNMENISNVIENKDNLIKLNGPIDMYIEIKDGKVDKIYF